MKHTRHVPGARAPTHQTLDFLALPLYYLLLRLILNNHRMWRRKSANEMIGSWIAVNFLFWELFLSSVVHLVYGLYIFTSAVAGDVAESLNLSFRRLNWSI